MMKQFCDDCEREITKDDDFLEYNLSIFKKNEKTGSIKVVKSEHTTICTKCIKNFKYGVKDEKG